MTKMHWFNKKKAEMKNILLIAIIAVFVLPTIGFSMSCSDYERDKAEYYAENAAKKIIDEYGGGRDIRVNVSDCNYNTFSKKYKLNIQIFWNGLLVRSNEYNIDGVLEFNSNGSGASFSQTYANKNVKDLNLFKNIARGVIILSALSSPEQHRSDADLSTYIVAIKNLSDKKIKLFIRYRDSSGNWVSAGWWTYKPSEVSRLYAYGEQVKSSSPYMYIHAEQPDGEMCKFVSQKSEHSIIIQDFEGRTYIMEKIEGFLSDDHHMVWEVACE